MGSGDWVKEFYTHAGTWWGPDAGAPELVAERVKTLLRLCRPEQQRILELGAGAGQTAAALADVGLDVVAVEFSPTYLQHAQMLARTPRKGALTIVDADFYAVELEGRFDVVCYWDGFGVGSDADHRRLLRRIGQEWLAPDGCVLMDVFSPFRSAQDAGLEERLSPLEGVPGSVEMIRRCHFDPVQCRWIDEWQPVAHPEETLAQTIRCYTPADFMLLLSGTGLCLKGIEVDGKAIDLNTNPSAGPGPLMRSYSYLAQLVADSGKPML